MDVITTHNNADFDSVGSMVAAKKLYPDAHLVFSGGEERTLHDFFIQTSLYSLDLKPIKSIDLEKVRRLILVDTRQLDRIGRFATLVGRPDVEIHVYDHHPEGENDIRGQIEVVERTGSCVAIMTKVLRKRGIEVNEIEATLMALGIYEDTGSLTFSSTTPDDHYAAAYLLERGANLATIADIMAHTMTAEQIFVLADLIRNAREYNVKGHRVTVTEASLSGFNGELALVVNRMRDVENLEVVIALIRCDDRIHLIARSRTDAVDVSRVAKHFGGGGHESAAAATIKDMTLIQAREALQGSLYSILRTPRTASSLMSYPVKTVNIKDTVSDAQNLMVRYNVNVLPVLDVDAPVGYITRAVVSRATHHGLKDTPVQEYMTADMITATPETVFPELYDMVVGRKQRVVPVLENGDLVGVVTRTDILNHMLDERTMGAIQGEGDNGTKTRPAHFRDLSGLLKEGLPETYREACRTIGQTAEETKMAAYLVGGFVRDLILRRPNLDLDIVVEGDAIALASAAAEKLGARMVPHQEFKTAVLILPDETKIDFATARLEYYEYPAALPIVEASSIKLDLYRRDFTFNTLIVCINPDQFAEMVDFFGAYQDLKDGQIRVLHNLSFIEDPTRVLRAVRFEQRFRFTIGRHTFKLLKSAVKTGFLARVDGKRLFAELKQIFEEEEPRGILLRLRDLNAIQAFHPRLRLEGKQERLLEQMEDVMSWFELLYLNENIEHWRVWLFALIGHLRQTDIKELLERLDLTAKMTESILDEKIQAENVLYKLSCEKTISNSRIFRLCSRVGTEGLLLVMAKSLHEDVRKRLSLYLTTLRKVHIEIGGFELMKIGFEPGPVFTEILDAVLDARLDNKVANREQEIAFVHGKFTPPEKQG